MSGEQKIDSINLSKINEDNIFPIEDLNSNDSMAVIIEKGYYFIIKERHASTEPNAYVSKESRQKISIILSIKAKEAIESNNAALAQELLTISLRYYSDNIDGINLYGKMLRIAGYLDDSISMFGRCLAVDPTNVEALISRANIYYREQNKHYEAEWHLRIAYKFHPNNIFVITTYASFLSDAKKDIDTSQKLYKQAIKILDDDYNEQKRIYNHNHRMKSKHNNNTNNNNNNNSLNDISNVKPKYGQPDVLYNYALFLAQHKRDFQNASVHAKKYLSHKPKDKDGERLLAELTYKLKKVHKKHY